MITYIIFFVKIEIHFTLKKNNFLTWSFALGACGSKDFEPTSGRRFEATEQLTPGVEQPDSWNTSVHFHGLSWVIVHHDFNQRWFNLKSIQSDSATLFTWRPNSFAAHGACFRPDCLKHAWTSAHRIWDQRERRWVPLVGALLEMTTLHVLTNAR